MSEKQFIYRDNSKCHQNAAAPTHMQTAIRIEHPYWKHHIYGQNLTFFTDIYIEKLEMLNQCLATANRQMIQWQG
jgi:hypothetical protein